MQAALKNLHYKKIWEKVIMNSNPTAKSLEEALERELLQKGCVYTYLNEVFTVLHRDDFEEYVGIKSYGHRGTCSRHLVHQIKPEILGRPITLFDVLKLLQKNIENGEFALMTNCVVLCNIDVTRNTSNDIFQYFVKKICDINNKSNLIEEQTPETWEKIANLID